MRAHWARPSTVAVMATIAALATIVAGPGTALAGGGPVSLDALPVTSKAPAPAAANDFPVRLGSGTASVTIPKKPDRVLCLSASSTQMLYAIGAGTQVVAVDKYSTWPAKAPRTKLTGYETSAEDYLRYKPDLVIVAFDEGTMVQQLAKLHIPALVLPPATGMAGVYHQLNELGRATGHRARAARVTAALKKHLTSAVSEAGGHGKGKTYYIELDPNPLYTATSATFIGAEFSLFGMRNIADKAKHGGAYPTLSGEYLLTANPDWVFLADTVCCHVTPRNFAARPGYDVLSAVKDHHVVGVNDSVASQWGPHTVDQFTDLLARDLEG